MKYVTILLVVLILSTSLFAQTDSIQSKVYTLANIKIEKDANRERRQILEGKGAVADYMEVHTTTIEPGKAAHAPHKHDDEELIIVKEGTLKVTIGGNTKIIGPGSVAFAIPGDMHGFENAGNEKATYYVIRYRTKTKADMQRAKTTGGSFIIDWNDIKFNTHDKGGIRRFFERPTAMINRFEMHVTTLNEGLKSHEPHTHKAEEIVLMISGDTEMQIGEKFYKGKAGDLYYLGSNVLHAIRNEGKGPCMYFAFQWD